MLSGRFRSIVIGSFVLAFIGLQAPDTRAQQPAIEIALPNQLARGQTTVVHIAVPSREMFRGAEVTPAAGVTIGAVSNRKPAELSQNVAWWDVTITVANDAAPGSRTLALLTPNGRSSAATVLIPAHVPTISNLRAQPAAGGKSVDVQFAIADASADVGDLPYVWFTIACGGEPTVGVVRGNHAAGTVRASIPRPASSACDLEVRASDAGKVDSNTLNTRIP